MQKLDTNHNRPYVRLRFIANAEEHNAGYNFLSWEPSKAYRWRLEWGPEGGGNVARVLLDGATIIQERYTRTYRPEMHAIELGIAERQESIVNVVYANVKIGPKQP